LLLISTEKRILTFLKSTSGRTCLITEWQTGLLNGLMQSFAGMCPLC
jgi:hypothetical protein